MYTNVRFRTSNRTKCALMNSFLYRLVRNLLQNTFANKINIFLLNTYSGAVDKNAVPFECVLFFSIHY